MAKEVKRIVYYLELTFKENKMRIVMKFLLGFIIMGIIKGQDLPTPAIVGEDLVRPTLRISEFVDVSDRVTVEDERITFGIRQLLQEAFSDTRYILTDDNNSDFVASVEVVYLGKPNEAFSIVGLFNRRSTKTEVRLLVKLENSKSGIIKSSKGEGEIATTITATGLQISEDVPFNKTELGGAVRKAIDDALSTLD
jgi:hypothetical protein|tara:strand:+ start:544 stop:1131 length:588 start_codon:yes stop_codon:yes gene_type:complete